VRRPPDFYAHMMDGETAALHDLPEHVRKLVGATKACAARTSCRNGRCGDGVRSGRSGLAFMLPA
jgi:hypothetical protein